MRKDRDGILSGPIYKQILIFFVPVFMGLLFQQLYNTVDAIVVGKYVGKEALGAVGGSTSTLINLLINFVTGLSDGATVIIAQYFGRRDEENVSRTVRAGMFIAITMGFFLTVVGIALTPMMLRMLNVPEDILPYSVIYMRVFLLGLIPTMIYNVGASILRATGDSKRPFYFLIVSSITNVVLDFVFVCLFQMGIAGVAVATCVAQIASAILVLIVLYKTDSCLHFSLKDYGFEKNTLFFILRVGLPMGIQSVLYSISNLSIQAAVNSYGTDTVAAYTAFGKIDALFWNFDSAFGSAALTIAGQNFGAGNIDRVKKTAKWGLILECSGSLLISAVSYFFGVPLLSIFTEDAGVIEIGLNIVKSLSPFWSCFAFIEILSSVIRGCGATISSMILILFGVCGIRIAWISFYPYTDVLGALRCYPISWAVSGVLFIAYYLSGLWLKGKKEK